MLNVAIKSLLAHKLRFLLTMFAIVLGVSMVAGAYVFTDSMSKSFSTLFDEVYSGVDVTVEKAEAEFGTVDPSFDESVLLEVQNTEGVEVAVAQVGGLAVIIDKQGDPIGGNGPPTFGLSWIDDKTLRSLVIKEGNGRSPSKAGEIVIDASTAKNNDFSIGDTVTVQLASRAQEFELVGIASFGTSDSLSGATMAIFELKEAQKLLELEGRYTGIRVRAKEGVDAASLSLAIRNNLDDSLEVVTGEEQTKKQQDDINKELGILTNVLLSLSFVSVFVGAFIIHNTFRIVVSQRSKELALLRAIGATKKQIKRLVLFEAFFVGLIASGFGILAGLGVSYLIRALGNLMGLNFPTGSLSLQPRTIIVSLLVGVGVTLLSALLPAIRASRVSPMEALRDNESNAKRKSLIKRGLVSLTVTALGGLLLLIGLSTSVSKPVIWVGFGAAIMFIGVSMFAPLLTRPLANLLSWPFKKIYGMPGKLAQENTKRSPRRTASTAAALMISVSLIVFVSIFASSMKKTVSIIIEDFLPADVAISLNGGFNAGVRQQVTTDLNTLPELKSVTRELLTELKIDDKIILVAAIDPESFGQAIKLDITREDYSKMANNGLIVNQKLLDKNNWTIGQELNVIYGNGAEQTHQIVAKFTDAYDANILIDRSSVGDAVGNVPDTVVFVNYADNVSDAEGRAAVDNVMKEYPSLSVQDKGELAKNFEEQLDQVLGMLWGFLGFSILIAVLGIANTLALSITERTRELGLLRAVGMTKSQIRRMVRSEAIMIALFGTTLGTVMGLFLSWAVLRSLRSEGFTQFVVPHWQIVGYFVMAVMAGVLASIWPSIKAAKVELLDAIKFE